MRRKAVWATAGGAYLLLGVLAWWHVFTGGISHTIAAEGWGDPAQQVWFIAWVPHALGSGLNPFVSHAMFAPKGINLVLNTSILLPALVLSPITVLFGPVTAFNVACVLAPAGSAMAAYAAFSRFVRFAPAAWLGGLAYGFSPFVLHDLADGHLHITILVVPPLVAMVLDDLLVRRRGSAAGRGAALGLLVVAQFLTSLEVLAMVVILSAVGCVLLAVRFPREALSRLRRAAGGVGVAAAIAAALLAYPAWVLLAGPRRYQGIVFPDAGAYVLWLKAVVWPIGGSPPTVWSAYIGIPLLVLVVVGGLWLVRRGTAHGRAGRAGGAGRVGEVGEVGGPPAYPTAPDPVASAVSARQPAALRFALVMALVSMAFAMGPRMYVTPNLGTVIPLPDRILSKLPLLQNMLPDRYSAMMDLFVAMALAITLDRMRERWAFGRPAHDAPSAVHRWRAPLGGLATVLVACATLVSPFLGSTWPYAARQVSVPAVYRSPTLTSDLSAGTILVGLPVPNGFAADPLIWQAAESMAYDSVAGYGFIPGPNGRAIGSLANNPVSFAFGEAELGLLPPEPSPSQVTAVRRQLRRWGVTTIVVLHVARAPGRLTRLLEAATSRSPERIDGAQVWTRLHWG